MLIFTDSWNRLYVSLLLEKVLSIFLNCPDFPFVPIINKPDLWKEPECWITKEQFSDIYLHAITLKKSFIFYFFLEMRVQWKWWKFFTPEKYLLFHYLLPHVEFPITLIIYHYHICTCFSINKVVLVEGKWTISMTLEI